MSNMFSGATDFNQDLSFFDVSKVTSVSAFFVFFVLDQTAELRDLLTSSSTSPPCNQMVNMFAGATVFKQDLCSFGDDLTMLPFVASSMFANTMCPVTTSPTDVSGPWCFNCPP